MHVASALQLRALPCGRLTARSSNNETRRPKRAAMLPRAQQQGGATADAPAAASVSAAVEQQAVPLVAAAADTAAQMEQQFEEVYVAAAESAAPGSGGGGAPEQVAAVAVAPPPPAGGRPRLPIDLSHPAVRVAGISAAVFLGGTLLITLWRMARDPEKKRSKTINKNKLVVDTIAKYLPGNRAKLSSSSFTLLKIQTGFSELEVFRKYLWFLLRERQFDEEALGDLVALKAALGLTDEQVAEALSERAKRVYEKYGTVMVDTRGLSQSGVERKAAARNLFNKLLSLVESRPLLAAEAAEKVDLAKIFGVTPRDILTLRSGYSAENEGQQEGVEEEGGEGGAASA